MAVVSRSLDDLAPDVRAMAVQFVQRARADGVDLLVTCTYRDDAAQAALYAMGRTVPGRIVTNARPGESAHNMQAGGVPASRALDVVPLVAGRAMWDTSGDGLVLWRRVGVIGEVCGLQWAGRWSGKLREYAHFQG
jgi:peptidoglycan L-alanyl-D-glutamate endopeptidase CwlK